MHASRLILRTTMTHISIHTTLIADCERFMLFLHYIFYNSYLSRTTIDNMNIFATYCII